LDRLKQLSNPFSTGGGGTHFENDVQTALTILMLANGYAPCFDNKPIEKILLQGKYRDFHTDDMIVFVKHPKTKNQNKLLTQIKHSISVIKSDKNFCETIKNAWEDFNNSEFEVNDKIALITGPLAKIDADHTRTLLELANYAENEKDFFLKINKEKFASNQQRQKLDVFREHLRVANKGRNLTKKQLWNFLKAFNIIIYDLDIKGTVISLLYTIIHFYAKDQATSIWGEVNYYVQKVSENAGTIQKSSVPEDIRNKFIKPDEKSIPQKYVKKIPWNKKKYSPELLFATFLGSWNENFEADIQIVSKFTKEDYSIWIGKLRNILQLNESPIRFNNNVWKVRNKLNLLISIGSNIFDEHIDSFIKLALIVLREEDPKFDLPNEKRFSASIYNKVLKHSGLLRNSILETLAILSNNRSFVNNCSKNKVKWSTALFVRELLKESNWLLWISLNDLLPTISEIAPEEFLDVVEYKLSDSEDIFNKIFNQESSGVFGNNYTTGLLWALESLAWDEKCFLRAVMLLGELAELDPGGNWANRPINSLIEIFLPWLPHTFADFEKRKAGLRSLNREYPEVAWSLALSLLPQIHQTSMETHKPKWIKISSSGFDIKVTNKEYWKQILFYSDFVVENCKSNIDRIDDVINNLDNLPKESFDKLLKYLSSKSIRQLEEGKRLGIWNSLIDFSNKHKKYSDAKWALPKDIIDNIEKVSFELKPKDPKNIYARLFVENDHDLFDEKGNWQDQRDRLEIKRKEAIKKILSKKENEEIFTFIDNVESSFRLGYTLGSMNEYSFDKKILPSLFDNDNRKFELFVNGYVTGKFSNNNWKWLDKITSSNWSKPQLAKIYKLLPFSTETWERVTTNLSDEEKLYWKSVFVNKYFVEGDVNYAVEKLLHFGRPISALNCINYAIHKNVSINVDKIILALNDALSNEELNNKIDSYHTIEIIKYLQQSKDVSENDLFQIEWSYLQLLDGHHGARPKLIESQLASDPELFCEVIRSLYRSKKQKSENIPLTEKNKNISTNSWRLLHHWRIPPGVNEVDEFHEKKFTKWLKDVKFLCEKSGHLEVALVHIGHVLYYAPSDKSGLWINKKVAEVLDKKEHAKMRSGFDSQVFNSRGFHSVDPEGKPEFSLAEKYNKKADDIENVGYGRFAATLRRISNSFKSEAESNIERHKRDIEGLKE